MSNTPYCEWTTGTESERRNNFSRIEIDEKIKNTFGKISIYYV
jgi:hypothetical protein